VKHSKNGWTAGINLVVEGQEREENIQQMGLVVKCKAEFACHVAGCCFLQTSTGVLLEIGHNYILQILP